MLFRGSVDTWQQEWHGRSYLPWKNGRLVQSRESFELSRLLVLRFFPFFRTNAQTVRRTIVAKSIELFDLSFVAYLNEAFGSVRPRFSTAYRSLFNSAPSPVHRSKKISSSYFFCCVNSINYSISFRNFTDRLLYCVIFTRHCRIYIA